MCQIKDKMSEDDFDDIPLQIEDLEKFDIISTPLINQFVGTGQDLFDSGSKKTLEKKHKKKSERLYDVDEIIELINEGLTRTSAQVQLLWVNYQNLLNFGTEVTMNLLKKQYEFHIKTRLKKERIYYKLIDSMSLAIPLDHDEFETISKKAKNKRNDNKNINQYCGHVGVEFNCIPEDTDLCAQTDYDPILFEEEYINNNQKRTSDTDNETEEGKTFEVCADPSAKMTPFSVYGRPSVSPVLIAKDEKRASELDNEYEGYHLFVLVHGYLGTAEDMSYYKQAISLKCSKPIFLLSTANEKNINDDIYTMGKNLAEEVISKIRDW